MRILLSFFVCLVLETSLFVKGRQLDSESSEIEDLKKRLLFAESRIKVQDSIFLLHLSRFILFKLIYNLYTERDLRLAPQYQFVVLLLTIQMVTTSGRLFFTRFYRPMLDGFRVSEIQGTVVRVFWGRWDFFVCFYFYNPFSRLHIMLSIDD